MTLHRKLRMSAEMRPATCHPERRYYVRGLCRSCHDIEWYREMAKTDRTFTGRRFQSTLNWQERLREAVINVYTDGEGTCRWCGQGDIDVLTVDHVNNDGAAHRRELKKTLGHWSGAGTGFYKWVIKNDYPEGFQILCRNCNHKKSIEFYRTRRELNKKLSPIASKCLT